MKEGYLDAGYNYIAIDDCWLENKRDANNRMVADRHRFPSGMKALADYVSIRLTGAWKKIFYATIISLSVSFIVNIAHTFL